LTSKLHEPSFRQGFGEQALTENIHHNKKNVQGTLWNKAHNISIQCMTVYGKVGGFPFTLTFFLSYFIQIVCDIVFIACYFQTADRN
jgi:hypothetical protein